MFICPRHLLNYLFCPVIFISLWNFANSCFFLQQLPFLHNCCLVDQCPSPVCSRKIKRTKKKKMGNSHPMPWLLFFLLYLFLSRYLLSFQMHCTGCSFLTFWFCFLDTSASWCHVFCSVVSHYILYSALFSATDLILQKPSFLLESRVTKLRQGRVLPSPTCSCYSLKLV